MRVRAVGPFEITPLGLGCMSLSHAYGAPPDPADAARLLNDALDLGYRLLDTAALYGFGANENLIGKALAGRRGSTSWPASAECSGTPWASGRSTGGRRCCAGPVRTACADSTPR